MPLDRPEERLVQAWDRAELGDSQVVHTRGGRVASVGTDATHG